MRFPAFLRHPIAIALSAVAVLLTPALLFAHARLVKSVPAGNASLDAAPTSIALWFSEKPELRFTSVQLLDSAGASIPLGAPTSVEENGVSLAVTRSLASGAYRVVWRTAASDGHPTTGKFSFRVAVAQTASPPTAPGVTIAPVLPPASREQPSPTPPAARWAELLAVLVIIGAIVFRLAVLPKAGWTDDNVLDVSWRAQRLALAATLLFVVTTIARVALQSQLIAGADSATAAVVAVVRDTRWGHGWGIGAVGAIFVGLGLLTAARSLRGWLVAAVGAVLICVGEALTGHAAALQQVALSVAADVTHVLGAGAWIGTLTVLLAVGLPALGRMIPSDAPMAGSSLARAYHTAAVDGVILVVLSGVTAAYLRLPSFSSLWTTDYGSWLFRKLVFVVIALAFGAYHWRTVVTRVWTDDTYRRFSRSALGELTVGLVIVGLTSLLISAQLPS